MTTSNRELNQACPAPQADFTACCNDTEASVIALSDGDREDPRLTNPTETVVAALLTVAGAAWNSEAGCTGAVEVAQVCTEGSVVEAALAAWRK